MITIFTHQKSVVIHENKKTFLTLLGIMVFSIKFDTVKSGWSYTVIIHVIISRKCCISFSEN